MNFLNTKVANKSHHLVIPSLFKILSLKDEIQNLKKERLFEVFDHFFTIPKPFTDKRSK